MPNNAPTGVGFSGRTLRMWVLPALACAVTTAACGSSSKPAASTTPKSSPGYVQGTKYSRCMRSHGVPSFPDPLYGGGFDIPTTINQQAPTYLTASKACAALQPAAQATRTPTERQKIEGLDLARCIRKHGLRGFPDPSLSPPTGDQPTIGRHGLYYVLPAGITNSPAFKHATAACGLHTP